MFTSFLYKQMYKNVKRFCDYDISKCFNSTN